MFKIKLVSLVLVGLVSGCHARRPRPVEKPNTEPVSPVLQRLQRDLEAGSRDVENAFWARLETRGTPLIEADPKVPGHMFVTFIWKGRAQTRKVLVDSDLTFYDEFELSRMPHSHLWYRTFRVRDDARFAYTVAELTRSTEHTSPEWKSDPLNPDRVEYPAHDGWTESGDIESEVALPRARAQPWVQKRSGVPAGQVREHRLKSTVLGSERHLWVYTPADYGADEQYGLLVFFDGYRYLHNVPTPTILDNMIADKKIAPIVGVFVDHPTPEARTADLGCNEDFARFVAQEIVPWIRRTHHVSHDPARTTVAGRSRGGLAAAYIGFRYPEVFWNVLSQSGGFWYKPPWESNRQDIDVPDAPVRDGRSYGWLIQQFAEAERRPLRLYMDVGVFENHLLWANRHMRDVLRAKGYDVTYQEFSGGHSSTSWRGTLSDGLKALLAPGN